jgi:small subunit ribosomal protein S6
MYSREYELVYVVRPDVADADVEAIRERTSRIIGERKGHVLRVDDWGKRKLAYEIQKFNKGHYVLFNFLSDPEVVNEVERTLRIDDTILRFLTVKRGDRVEVDARIAEEARRASLPPAPPSVDAPDDAMDEA